MHTYPLKTVKYALQQYAVKIEIICENKQFIVLKKNILYYIIIDLKKNI